MSRILNTQDMEVVREKDRVLREKEYAEAAKKVAVNTYTDTLFLAVARCVDGPSMGSFRLTEVMFEDGGGKPLKKPGRRVLIEAVDRDSLNKRFDKEVGKRYFK